MIIKIHDINMEKIDTNNTININCDIEKSITKSIYYKNIHINPLLKYDIHNINIDNVLVLICYQFLLPYMV